VSLRTTYEFALPRGYVDDHGALHRTGTMRLATARDELEPLRDPTISGPDDPRLTIVVLARVVQTLGSLELVTAHEIEGLFAADLAYLQDFYGVINFGTQAEFDEFVAAQQADPIEVRVSPPAVAVEPVEQWASGEGDEVIDPDGSLAALGRGRRSAIEEIPAETR
jgi:hypothetical protein